MDIEVEQLLDKGMYPEQIYKVQDYIERNLEQPLRAEALCRLAGFSTFHFQRIFSLVTGEPLHTFIKRLRLEKAAYLLVTDKDLAITEVALTVGFSNQASFAKAFKSRFGVSASTYRKNKEIYESSVFRARPEVDTDTEILPICIEVRQEDAHQVIYVRYSGPYKGNSKLFSGLFNTLYQWAAERNLIDESSRWFVMYHDSGDETDEDALRLSVCLSVKGNVAVSGAVGIMELSGGKYGVGTFKVNAAEYGKAWYYMYADWLAKSKYKMDDRFAFEHYPPQDEYVDRQLVEVYLPIK